MDRAHKHVEQLGLLSQHVIVCSYCKHSWNEHASDNCDACLSCNGCALAEELGQEPIPVTMTDLVVAVSSRELPGRIEVVAAVVGHRLEAIAALCDIHPDVGSTNEIRVKVRETLVVSDKRRLLFFLEDAYRVAAWINDPAVTVWGFHRAGPLTEIVTSADAILADIDAYRERTSNRNTTTPVEEPPMEKENISSPAKGCSDPSTWTIHDPVSAITVYACANHVCDKLRVTNSRRGIPNSFPGGGPPCDWVESAPAPAAEGCSKTATWEIGFNDDSYAVTFACHDHYPVLYKECLGSSYGVPYVGPNTCCWTDAKPALTANVEAAPSYQESDLLPFNGSDPAHAALLKDVLDRDPTLVGMSWEDVVLALDATHSIKASIAENAAKQVEALTEKLVKAEGEGAYWKGVAESWKAKHDQLSQEKFDRDLGEHHKAMAKLAKENGDPDYPIEPPDTCECGCQNPKVCAWCAVDPCECSPGDQCDHCDKAPCVCAAEAAKAEAAGPCASTWDTAACSYRADHEDSNHGEHRGVGADGRTRTWLDRHDDQHRDTPEGKLETANAANFMLRQENQALKERVNTLRDALDEIEESLGVIV